MVFVSDPNGSYKAITGELYSDVSHSNGTMTRTCSVDVMVTKSTMEHVFVCAVSQSETGFQKQVYLSLDVNSKYLILHTNHFSSKIQIDGVKFSSW